MKINLTKAALAAGAIAIAPLLAAMPQANAMTYTLEPLNYGIPTHITPLAFGGSMCPCTNVAFRDDALHNQQGEAAVASIPWQLGDLLLAFSNGSVVAQSTLADYPNAIPVGVPIILIGPTGNPYGYLVAHHTLDKFGKPIPPDDPHHITYVFYQYEKWSDWPTVKTNMHDYHLAVRNAKAGRMLHDYKYAQLDNPGNITWTDPNNPNITYVMIPTTQLPIDNRLRRLGLTNLANKRDAKLRPLIDAAYATPQPTPQQLAAAATEQVPVTAAQKRAARAAQAAAPTTIAPVVNTTPVPTSKPRPPAPASVHRRKTK